MKTVKLRNQSTETLQAKLKELSHAGFPRMSKAKDGDPEDMSRKHSRSGRRENNSIYYRAVQAEIAGRFSASTLLK